jgi:hypothetical protein
MTLIAIITVSSFGVAGIGGGATFAALIVLSALDFPVALAGLLISIEPLIDTSARPATSPAPSPPEISSPAVCWGDRHGGVQQRARGVSGRRRVHHLIRLSGGVDPAWRATNRERGGVCPPRCMERSARIVIIGGEAAGMSAAAKGAPAGQRGRDSGV